jgi:glycosyltransferase involved in cell wall biosynthesis
MTAEKRPSPYSRGTMGNAPRFTVVVPTRDRPRALARCLAALEQQEGCGEFEIVVVDDGSSQADEVAGAVAQSRRARLIRTAPVGSSPARNHGVRAARGPIILLVDDDCEPRDGWAAALLATLERGADIAAGRGVNADSSGPFGEATQTVLDHLTLQSRLPGGEVGFAPTYNLACRRSVLLEVPFDERYGNSGADRDWCVRLAQRGYAIVLDPDAVVDHRQTFDLGLFWIKHHSYGRGSARFHRTQGVRFERPGFYVGLLRAGFGRGPKVGIAVCLAQLATAAGFATEALSLRRS